MCKQYLYTCSNLCSSGSISCISKLVTWSYANYGATNLSGFGGLPGDFIGNNGNGYASFQGHLGDFGYWYLYDLDANGYPQFLSLANYNSEALLSAGTHGAGLSIRCIKD